MHRKPTFTGLGLNFFSFIPYIYKINSIMTLLQRAYNVSSNYTLFNAEIERLKDYFVSNKFPLHVFERTVSRFLDKLFSKAIPVSGVPKKRVYMKIPFYGPVSYKTRNELRRILGTAFFHVDFRIILTSSFTIGSFFKTKDRIPSDVQSFVVYNYQCSSCNARYIGSTCRSFKSRRLEHMGLSIHTGNPLSNPEYSSIRNHSEVNDHRLLHKDFKILKVAPTFNKLLITESILIQKHRPLLNSNNRSLPLYIQWN